MAKSFEAITKLNAALNDAKGTLSKTQLARTTGTNLRTIERHLAFLKDKLGAPLECETGTSAYFYRQGEGERFELPGIWFDKDELAALFAIKQLVAAIPDGTLSKVADGLWKRIEKVGLEEGQLPETGWKDRIKVLSIAGRHVDDRVFRETVNGLVNAKRLSIVQKSLGKTTVTREVSPLQLVRYRDNWYLDAWCHMRDGYRSFALSRIEKVESLDKPAVHKSSRSIAEHFASSYGIFNGAADKTAKILFRGIAAEEVSKETWHSLQQGRFLENGDYELTLPFGSDKELLMDILRWGEHAIVLEPESLRLAMMERLRKTLESY